MAQRKGIFVCTNYDWGYPRDECRHSVAPQIGTQPFRSYGVNIYVVAFDPPSTTRLAAIERPANVVIVGENAGGRDFIHRDDRPDSEFCGWMMARQRHQKGANYILADGHAKWWRAPDNWRTRSGGPVVYQHCCDARGNDDQAWFWPLAGCDCGPPQP
jgi:prepilin-type processing-associated H-X9-DG protein